MRALTLIVYFSSLWIGVIAQIDRKAVVSRFNPTRNASSLTTPMQVGNGNFAFGADVTGLQTFLPYAIMSYWGWKNDTFPVNKTLIDIEDYTGVSWWNHDRLVTYMFGGDPTVQQWLIANPNRANLGSIGLVFVDEDDVVQNITEDDLTDISQELDLWTGIITSQFSWQGEKITVTTSSAQDSSTVGVSIQSTLLNRAQLGVFLDFPWNDGSAKFEAPFVGYFNMTSNHTTSLETKENLGLGIHAEITHTMVNNTFVTSIGGDSFNITRDGPTTHRYTMRPFDNASTFSFTAYYSPVKVPQISDFETVNQSSASVWEKYWQNSGFVDLTESTDPRAYELQRRIILSRYLMRVNEAGDTPPQESGLVNTGWYGKFHMEMYFWHCMHWGLWNNWDLLDRSNTIYSRFLETSLQRAQIQEHWDIGARWSKMTDPSGRSAPGEINELLIWQQPHPLIFAEYEYRAFPTSATLHKWKDVVNQTANWMADFAWYNRTTGVYDLGPPMYTVAEDTSPNITINPAFELAYWKYGLQLAGQWMQRLGEEVPSNWSKVKEGLAPLPVQDGLYVVYEGIPSDFWNDTTFINDHPSLVGLYGWLPQTPGVDIAMVNATAHKVWADWNITNCWGWDFPMLAMNAARSGEPDQAISWLLDPLFQFDDVGMPIGGVRVPTPYFPGSGGLLYTIAMMAAGWDGSDISAPGFPETGWQVQVEGISRAL
ncbi:Six-hairpin glycosidase-like protein [Hygrophoropsis aurantiaca]|uniref:Six-hairpin glycosidase-like protein n=1 Tax=Hygrophoropsis aurantiaca TaxID=72124 RepID=A0ACB8AI63_9AGAM|nr:Six-hairpin glycosidase-like protein [Hygrophoropsis aurantiaca]